MQDCVCLDVFVYMYVRVCIDLLLYVRVCMCEMCLLYDVCMCVHRSVVICTCVYV